MNINWKDVLGDVYTDELEQKIKQTLNTEIPKEFVSKKDFNEKVKKIGEHEKTIQSQTTELDNLRSTNVDAAEVQRQLKEKDDAHAAEIAQLKLGFAVELALKDAGARNPATVKPLLEGFMQDAKFNEDGDVEGLADKIKQLTEDASTAFLFETKKDGDGSSYDVSGAKPGNPGNKGKGEIDSENLTYSQIIAQEKKTQ